MKLHVFSIVLVTIAAVIISGCTPEAQVDTDPEELADVPSEAAESDDSSEEESPDEEADADGPSVSGPTVRGPTVRGPNVNRPSVNEAEVNEAEVNEAEVNEAEVNEAEVNEAEVSEIESPPEATPTPTPIPIDWDEAYDELLAEYGGDYAVCEVDDTETSVCERPESLGEIELREQINIQLILDSSGSMAGEIDGEVKLDVAKDALRDFINVIPEVANVSLRVYGHVGSNNDADRELSCANTELLYPFEPLDQETFNEAIDSFQPTGWTPIASSLEEAQADLAQFDPTISTNFIYLVSDGIETCDGDPVAVARELHESDIEAIVNIVGFDVDAEATAQLQEVAEAGGGTYYEADNAEEMDTIFGEVYDWNAWSRYYTCVSNNARRTFTEIRNDQNRRRTCIVNTANREYTSIQNAVTRNRDRYGPVRDEILDAADEKRDRLIDEADQMRDEIVEAAQQERDDAIDTAREERDSRTTSP